MADPLLIGVAGALAMLILILAGMRIAFAAGLVGLVGLIVLRGFDPAVGLGGLLAYSEVSHYTLSVVPLFILIGYLSFHAGLTQGAFDAARAWLGRLPGGLAVSTVFAAAGFAAVSGASTATAAVFARVAVPEMLKSGYSQRLAGAVVAVGGTLAALIPPSAILVIYGVLVEQSIGALLLAGFVPGLVTAVVYAATVMITVKLDPGLAQPEPVRSFVEKLRALKSASGLLAVILIIVGGLYTGWMTPTEVGGVGAFIVFVMALARRETTRRDIAVALIDTAKLTAMVMTIVFCALIFVRFLGFTGLPPALAEMVAGLDVPRLYVLLAILGVYLVLGMFIDGLGMLLLTLPVVFPVILKLGYDPIWFGVIVVKMIEIGLITPPVGLNCFVVSGVRPDIPVETVFRGAVPFVIADLVTVGVMIAFPDIVLWLPGQMAAGGE
ncbi:MAG: TRAP transporter large permease [Alphaproteobacteria bacterium]|nr:TRAP transporter large permease [Alphaproteobacteria bacterium]